MNPTRLEMLSLLASLGTVRAVAARLHLSPSAVSAQLSVLESEAGHPLLRRVGRRVELTAAGQALVPHARSILDQLRLARQEVGRVAGERVTTVRVAAFTSAARSLLLPLAGRLAAAAEPIRVEIAELDTGPAVQALRQGECDLAVISDAAEYPVPGADLRVRSLLVDPLLVVGPVDDPDLADGGRVRLEALARRRFATDLPGSYLATALDRACAQAGFDPIVVGRMSSYELLLAHVEAGLSITVLPSMAVDRRYRVVACRPAEPLHRTVSMVARAAVIAGGAGRTVAEALLTSARAAQDATWDGKPAANGGSGL